MIDTEARILRSWIDEQIKRRREIIEAPQVADSAVLLETQLMVDDARRDITILMALQRNVAP
jgi:hypothetical protein